MYASSYAIGFNAMVKQGQTFEGKFDGVPRFEIDDSGATLSPEGIAKAAAGQRFKLRELLNHPELYRAYPCLEKLEVLAVDMSADRGGYSRRYGNITVSSRIGIDDVALGCVLHEVQHCIQQIEGFTQGASPELLYSIALKAHRAEMGTTARDKVDDQTHKRLESSAMSDYKAAYGEIESRDVQARMHMTKQERSATPPYSSQNYTREQARKPIELTDGWEEKMVTSKLRTAQVVATGTAGTSRLLTGLFGSSSPTSVPASVPTSISGQNKRRQMAP